MPLKDPLTIEQAAATQYKMLEHEYEMFSSENKMILDQEISFVRDLATLSIALLGAGLTVLGFHLPVDPNLLIYGAIGLSGSSLYFAYYTRSELIRQAVDRDTYLKGRHLDILLLGDELAELEPAKRHGKLLEYNQSHPLEFPEPNWILKYGRLTVSIFIFMSFILLVLAVITNTLETTR